LEVSLFPETDVKGVVKPLRAKDDSLKGAFFHLADVIPDKIRVGDVPTILDDFLSRTLLRENIHRKK